MAESTLTLGWADLKKAVGEFLGMGLSGWSAGQTTTIEAIVQERYRRVLYPPAIPGISPKFQWSFLRPCTTIDISADDSDYDLPDNFGTLIGSFHYAADLHKVAIKVVSVEEILELRSASDYNSAPALAAIRWKSSDGSTGQRQEVLFYPEPDADYTLTYRYNAYSGRLSDSAPYPLGGMEMSELYRSSCLAAAERYQDQVGLHSEQYQQLLIAQVQRDAEKAPQYFGNMSGPSEIEDEWVPFRRGSGLYRGAYDITYKGAQI